MEFKSILRGHLPLEMSGIAKFALGAVLLASGADAFAPTLSSMGTSQPLPLLEQVLGALEAWSSGLACYEDWRSRGAARRVAWAALQGLGGALAKTPSRSETGACFESCQRQVNGW
jgi:hypothetical protein